MTEAEIDFEIELGAPGLFADINRFAPCGKSWLQLPESERNVWRMALAATMVSNKDNEQFAKYASNNFVAMMQLLYTAHEAENVRGVCAQIMELSRKIK